MSGIFRYRLLAFCILLPHQAMSQLDLDSLLNVEQKETVSKSGNIDLSHDLKNASENFEEYSNRESVKTFNKAAEKVSDFFSDMADNSEDTYASSGSDSTVAAPSKSEASGREYKCEYKCKEKDLPYDEIFVFATSNNDAQNKSARRAVKICKNAGYKGVASLWGRGSSKCW